MIDQSMRDMIARFPADLHGFKSLQGLRSRTPPQSARGRTRFARC